MRPSANWRTERVARAASLPSTPQLPPLSAARRRFNALRAALAETTGTTPETPASQQQQRRRVPRGQASHVHRVVGAADVRAAYHLMRTAIDGTEDDEDSSSSSSSSNDSSSSPSSGVHDDEDDFVHEVELRSGPQTFAVLRQMIQELDDDDGLQQQNLLSLLSKLRPAFALTPFFASEPLVDNLTEQELYSTSLTYARLQPAAFRRQYLQNFLQECVSAHDDGSAVCLLGLKERLLFALAQATSGLLEHPKYGAEYSALAAALVPPDLTRSRLFGMISTCTETLRGTKRFGPDRAANAGLVEQCVRERIQTDLGPLALRAPGVEALLRATMAESASEFAPPTPGGGTHRRRRHIGRPSRRRYSSINMRNLCRGGTTGVRLK